MTLRQMERKCDVEGCDNQAHCDYFGRRTCWVCYGVWMKAWADGTFSGQKSNMQLDLFTE